MNNWSFDATGTEAPEEFKPNTDPVPVGKWICALTAAEQKPIKDNKGWGFACEFTILDGPHKGRKAWPFLSAGHIDAITRGYAEKDITAMCHATGVMKLLDISQLFNIPMIAYWGQKPPTMENGLVKYPAKNTVRGFVALSAGGAGKQTVGNIAPAPAAKGVTPPSWAAKKAG